MSELKNKSKLKNRRSQLSQQLLLQYVIAIAVYIGVLAILVLIAWNVGNSLIWQETHPLYWPLKFIKGYILVFVGLAIMLGWISITYYFISRPLRYLDDVVAAAEQLVTASDMPIHLAPAMIDTENELNLVREKAHNDARSAKEAEQRKNDLVVYLAHDLKTPLTSVIGYLMLLRDEPEISQELRRKYTDIALSKAERLEELINEFFEVTRFNLTVITLEEEFVNLTRMIEQITHEFQPILDEKGLGWQSELEQGIHIVCDSNKISRVLDNLFRNAVNYSYKDTKVGVTLKKEGNWAVVQIENKGRTIPEEKLNRIFEQFFRLDSSRTSTTGGSGLGLAIAKEIVELHGGRIRAQSAEEHIILTVVLPINSHKIV